METSKPKGVIMKDDVVPVAEQKTEEPKKNSGQHGSYTHIIVYFAVYVMFFVGAILGNVIKQRNERIDVLSRANFGEVVNQRMLTLEEAATDSGVTARMGPQRWYDEYCVIGGRVNDDGDYDYVRLTPEAYEVLKYPSKFERENNFSLSLYGRANCVLRERREKVHEVDAPPEGK